MQSHNSKIARGEANLDDIIFTLAVNFLLYVVLIIVFYMLVRFYLEEETSHTTDYSKSHGYSKVATEEDEEIEIEI
jgi:cytochrome bd-type quinol oxidase subunit 1